MDNDRVMIMKSYGTFTRYSKAGAARVENYIQNEEKIDFYQLRNDLAEADAKDAAAGATYLGVRQDGLVVVASNDVDLLFPQDLQLVSIDKMMDPSGAVGKIVGADGTLTAAPAVTATSASKLGLVRALREKGDWAAVKTALAANADLQDDWDAAQSIARSDPLTTAMIATMKYSAADVDALLLRAGVLAST